MAKNSLAPTVNVTVYGTFNLVGHDQNNYDLPSALSGRGNTSHQPRLPQRIIDAPIHRLSIHFAGRRKEFEFLKEALTQRPGNLPSRCVIYGMPGIGKTQLILQYVKASFDNDWYSHIFWTSATTVDKLIQGFANILDLVDDRGRYVQEQSAKLTSVRLWLEGSHRDGDINWLLIVDNVHRDVLDFLSSHLPRGKIHGSILFTTRTTGVAEALANAAGVRYPIIRLQTLDVKEAINLLIEDAGIDSATATPSELGEAEELVKCVGRLPLAVVHAASFIKETGTTLCKMLELYNSEHKSEVIRWENDLNSYEEQSVASTFTNQFNQLNEESRDISNLLKVLSFLDPESIPVKMIVQGARRLSDQGLLSNPSSLHASLPESPCASTSSLPSSLSLPKRTLLQKLKGWSKSPQRMGHSVGARADDTTPASQISSECQSLISLILSPIEFPKAIQKLNNLSLVEHRPNIGNSSLWIHDLIQFMMRESTRTEESYQEWLQLSVSLVCGAFRDIKDHGSPRLWPECEKFMLHIRSLDEAWDDAYGMNNELAEAKTTMTLYLWRRGRYVKAEELCKQAVEVRKKNLGADHIDTLISMHNLALVYRSQGRYHEAEILYKQVLASQEKVIGANHPDTLTSMHNLASVYMSQGQYNKAETLHKQELSGSEKLLGANHPDTLASMHNLASVYRSQGRYKESETLHKQVLASREKVLGANHPDTLTSMNNLASVYWSQERYDEAEVLYKQVLASREKVMGANHPHTLTSMNNLGSVYWLQKRYDEAAAIYKSALSGFEKSLGSSHPCAQRTADSLRELQRQASEANQDEESLA